MDSDLGCSTVSSVHYSDCFNFYGKETVVHVLFVSAWKKIRILFVFNLTGVDCEGVEPVLIFSTSRHAVISVILAQLLTCHLHGQLNIGLTFPSFIVLSDDHPPT